MKIKQNYTSSDKKLDSELEYSSKLKKDYLIDNSSDVYIINETKLKFFEKTSNTGLEDYIAYRYGLVKIQCYGTLKLATLNIN